MIFIRVQCRTGTYRRKVIKRNNKTCYWYGFNNGKRGGRRSDWGKEENQLSQTRLIASLIHCDINGLRLDLSACSVLKARYTCFGIPDSCTCSVFFFSAYSGNWRPAAHVKVHRNVCSRLLRVFARLCRRVIVILPICSATHRTPRAVCCTRWRRFFSKPCNSCCVGLPRLTVTGGIRVCKCD